MIFDVNGKQIAFGMLWKSRLSEGDIHSIARAAKSPFFWHAERSHFFGLLKDDAPRQEADQDAKLEPHLESSDKTTASKPPKKKRALKPARKLKAPIYAGAVAILQTFPDVPNLAVVLAIPPGGPELPAGGFIVCCIHQSRPRNDYDVIVPSEVAVSEVLKSFQQICGAKGFVLYGDVRLSGITPATMADVITGANPVSALRKTKSALINPLASTALGAILLIAATYAYKTYEAHKKAEAQRIVEAAQKNSQQLYNEEVTARRLDSVVLARDIPKAIESIRAMNFSIRGWALAKSTCAFAPEKHMTCTLEYKLSQHSKGTYETFVEAAKHLANLEFAGDIIKGTAVVKTLPFVPQSTAIDAAKTQRDEVIEFTSSLQRIRHLGEPKIALFEPIFLPAGANLGELTEPPITAANWEFAGPVRNAKHLEPLPEYAIVTQLVLTFGTQPMYEEKQSIGMVTVTGKILSR